MNTNGERRIGRRALVTGGLAGAAAAAVTTVTRATPVAANSHWIHPGANSVSQEVGIYRGANTIAQLTPTPTKAFNARADGDLAIEGTVTGSNGIGVRGRNNGNSTGIGVEGISKPEGIAVRAETENGVAVWAECTGGEALRAIGPTVFSRSGKLNFAQGQTSKTVTGNRLTADSLVVATIQGDVAGTWVRGVTVRVSAPQSFTIRLNKPAPQALKVGWFLVN